MTLPTEEKQFNHQAELNDWQDLPELELFDDELAFIKKDNADSLAELEETDELSLAHQLTDTSTEGFDELGLTELSSINPPQDETYESLKDSQESADKLIPDDLTQALSAAPLEYKNSSNTSNEAKLDNTQTMLTAINQLTQQIAQLSKQVERLKTSKPVNNPQKLFATGVYYAKHQDYIHAAKWFRRAALAGHAKAMFYLGTMFIKAEGLPQSVTHSYIWMTLANVYGATEAKAVAQDLQKYLTAKELNLAQRIAADKYEEIEDALWVDSPTG